MPPQHVVVLCSRNLLFCSDEDVGAVEIVKNIDFFVNLPIVDSLITQESK